MKEIKDYLHLYLGCGCELIEDYTDGMISFNVGQRLNLNIDVLMQVSKGWMKVKPILRNRRDMTEEEKHYCDWQVFNGDTRFFYTTDTFLYLLSKHFDLFGLIESGLAIDATTLK